MPNVLSRARVQRVTGPIGAALVRAGLSPDAMTLIGTLGVVLASVFLVVPGYYLAGGIVITFFALTDMLDGAMARARGRASRWGAFLDSTCDRLADSAVFAAAAYWQFDGGHKSAAVAALLCLISGSLISYAKARAEGVGLTANVGIAERTVRLVILGFGGVLEAVGVPHGFEIILWVLFALSTFTVGQRVKAVWNQTREDRAPLPPAGTPIGGQPESSVRGETPLRTEPAEPAETTLQPDTGLPSETTVQPGAGERE